MTQCLQIIRNKKKRREEGWGERARGRARKGRGWEEGPKAAPVERKAPKAVSKAKPWKGETNKWNQEPCEAINVMFGATTGMI